MSVSANECDLKPMGSGWFPYQAALVFGEELFRPQLLGLLRTGEIGRIEGFRFIVSKPVSFARLNRRGPISRWKLKR